MQRQTRTIFLKLITFALVIGVVGTFTRLAARMLTASIIFQPLPTRAMTMTRATAPRRRRHTFNDAIKRGLDVTGAAVGLFLTAPVMLVVAVLVRFKLGSPVFFVQERPGQDGKIFRMFKFRTMTDTRDASGNLLPDADRLTRFGAFLRKTSLDELPELINVLRGEMSLVGPRPLLTDYLPLYNATQARRHDVRPGITGWAQVSGRNSVDWTKRFDMDVWYVENRSVLLDLRILIKTVQVVLKRDGISKEGHATMTRFTGSEPIRYERQKAA